MFIGGLPEPPQNMPEMKPFRASSKLAFSRGTTISLPIWADRVLGDSANINLASRLVAGFLAIDAPETTGLRGSFLGGLASPLFGNSTYSVPAGVSNDSNSAFRRALRSSGDSSFTSGDLKMFSIL